MTASNYARCKYLNLCKAAARFQGVRRPLLGHGHVASAKTTTEVWGCTLPNHQAYAKSLPPTKCWPASDIGPDLRSMCIRMKECEVGKTIGRAVLLECIHIKMCRLTARLQGEAFDARRRIVGCEEYIWEPKGNIIRSEHCKEAQSLGLDYSMEYNCP